MSKKGRFIFVSLLNVFVLLNCSSSVTNLGSARIKRGNNFSVNLELRHIENRSSYREASYDGTANAYGIKYSHGSLNKNTGLEYGIKFGLWQHFHWKYQEGSSTDYFPYTWMDFTEGAEVFRLNPYLKFGFNQNKPLKFAFVVELPAGAVIASYDYQQFTPYVSGRVSLTKYENPVGYHWRQGMYYESEEEKNKIAFLPALGCDIRILNNTVITVEGGVILNYYRTDNLYVFGFNFNF